MRSKELALPRASHSGEIALAGSRCRRSTLAVAPVLFAPGVVTETKIVQIISPSLNCPCIAAETGAPCGPTVLII